MSSALRRPAPPPPDVEESRGGGMQLISRAAAVLRALEGRQAGLSLGAIAREAGLPRATVQRIVDALALEGLVLIDPAGGGVRLGPALVRMAASVHTDMVALARPQLEELCREARETVLLSVLRDGRAVLVDQVVPERDIRLMSRLGNAFPLHSTADGKAVLAGLPEAEVRALVGDALARPTPRTLPTVEALLEELAGVARRGHATDIEENMEGICAVAAPLRDMAGMRYSVSLLVPTARFRPALEGLRAALLRCRAAIEAKVGAPRA